MSTCRFCGQKAGLFKNVHKECMIAYETGTPAVVNMVSQAICEGSDFSRLESDVKNLATNSFIKEHELTELYYHGFDKSIESFLDDGVITVEEEQKILNFKKHFNDLSLDNSDSFQKVVKSLVLRDVMESKLPARLDISGDLPFLLQKRRKCYLGFSER